MKLFFKKIKLYALALFLFAWLFFIYSSHSVSSQMATPTPTPSPTPTAPAAVSFYKLKNVSYRSLSSSGPVSVFPASIQPYDGSGDDDGSKNFIIGNNDTVGTALAPGKSLGTAQFSQKSGWDSGSYNSRANLTATDFIAYVKSRKKYTTITSFSSSQITQKGLYFWNGSLPAVIDDSALDTFKNLTFILVVDGTLNINVADFNPSKSVALVANTIVFSSQTTAAKGIFIANTVDLGTTTNQGLKITGNLITTSTTAVNISRNWNPNTRPALFVVFDVQPYIELLPCLSTRNYEWQKLSP